MPAHATIEIRLADHEPIISIIDAAANLAEAVGAYLAAVGPYEPSARIDLADELERFKVAVAVAEDWAEL